MSANLEARPSSSSVEARAGSPPPGSWRATGHRPIVLEREPLVGGLCATHAMTRDDGTWRFDLGGHRFVSSDERRCPAGSRGSSATISSRRSERASSSTTAGASSTRSTRGTSCRTSGLARERARPRRLRARAGAAGASGRAPDRHVRGLGRRPLRPAPLRHLLRPLHRRSSGASAVADLRRLGGRADLAPQPRGRRAAPGRAPRHADPDVRAPLPLSAARDGPALRAPRAGGRPPAGARCGRASRVTGLETAGERVTRCDSTASGARADPRRRAPLARSRSPSWSPRCRLDARRPASRPARAAFSVARLSQHRSPARGRSRRTRGCTSRRGGCDLAHPGAEAAEPVRWRRRGERR